jgi:hypothetical protein
VQPGLVRAGDPAIEILGGIDEQALVPGRIIERLVKRGGMRAE